MAFKFSEGYKLPIEIEDKTFMAHVTGTTHEDILTFGTTLQAIDTEAGEEAMAEAEDVILGFLEIVMGADAVDEIDAMVPDKGSRTIHLIALAQYVITEINKGGAEAHDKKAGPGAAANNRAQRRKAEREGNRANKKKTGPQLVD